MFVIKEFTKFFNNFQRFFINSFKTLLVDIIILSLTNSDSIFEMTQKCINSIIESEPLHEFNILLLESNKNSEYSYENCKVLVPDFEEFNYNKFMNFGIENCKAELVVLCNNDLLFHKNWLTNILKHYEEADSFSPWNNFKNWHKNKFQNNKEVIEGYRTSYEIAGWCLVCKRKIFDKFKLNETVKFWYSDNVYADDLQRFAFKHLLVCDSFVDHLCSKTTETFEESKIKELTTNQKKIYEMLK